MRKLKLLVQTSVDGFIADVNDKTDWMIWNWGEEWNWDDALKAHFIMLTDSVDTILLSRKMAEEGFNDHWARATESSNTSYASFARMLTAIPKIVFTHTLEQSVWPNNTLAKGDLTEEVNRLKHGEGKYLIAYGGASFVSSLIRAKLIDEFHLFVNPAVLGAGKTIFPPENGRLNLSLVSTRPYECGVTVLSYVPEK